MLVLLVLVLFFISFLHIYVHEVHEGLLEVVRRTPPFWPSIARLKLRGVRASASHLPKCRCRTPMRRKNVAKRVAGEASSAVLVREGVEQVKDEVCSFFRWRNPSSFPNLKLKYTINKILKTQQKLLVGGAIKRTTILTIKKIRPQIAQFRSWEEK